MAVLTVFSLIADVLKVVKAIEQVAQHMQGFPEESARLSRRCKRLSDNLETLRLSPYAYLFQENIQCMKGVFEDAENFLTKLGKISKAKRALGHARYAQEFHQINNTINEHLHDLCLSLHIKIPGEEASRLSRTQWVEWDVTEAPSAKSVLGTRLPLASYASNKDNQIYHSRVQRLLVLDQSIHVTAVRVCLAHLDPGDSTYAVRAGKLAGKVAAGAPLALPTAMLKEDPRTIRQDRLGGYLNRSWTRASNNWTNRFLHFLLELDLEDGTMCTLERCADDVYLYEGESSRRKKQCVLSNEHVKGISIGDLIRIRNEERKVSYKLNGNSCIDFAWKTLCFLNRKNYIFVVKHSDDGWISGNSEVKSAQDFTGRCRSFYQTNETASICVL